MTNLPPEDQLHTFTVGPVTDIPVHYDDDPRLETDRHAWSNARRIAQAKHLADDLLQGLRDDDWRVRLEVVDRLIARAGNDLRTLSALCDAAATDRAWQVRDAIVSRLTDFGGDTAVPVLEPVAIGDVHPEVRESAKYALRQLGRTTSE